MPLKTFEIFAKIFSYFSFIKKNSHLSNTNKKNIPSKSHLSQISISIPLLIESHNLVLSPKDSRWLLVVICGGLFVFMKGVDIFIRKATNVILIKS